jgi:hypothetical protein
MLSACAAVGCGVCIVMSMMLDSAISFPDVCPEELLKLYHDTNLIIISPAPFSGDCKV